MRASVSILLLLTVSASAHVGSARQSAGALALANAPSPLGAPESEAGAASCVITGTVLDPSSAAVAGAHVMLNKTDGRPLAKATTDRTGSFRFEKLTPGDYELDVQQKGFRESKMIVNAGENQPAPVRIVLSLAIVNEEVTVAAADSAPRVSMDTAQNQSANILDRSALDRVPVFDEDYIAMVSRFLDQDAIGTNGVTLVVNGVESNGPGVTPSAVQEVKINQNPYSALFSRPGRARLEITIKEGTKNFHGTANIFFRDSLFDASNAFAVTKPPEQRRYYEGSLTGPAGHSHRTSFLASLQRDEQDQQAIVVAEGVNGAIHENIPAPARHLFGSGRIFHDIGQADQFWIGYSYEQNEVRNQGVGGTVLPEAGTERSGQEQEIRGGYRRVVSPKMVNQLLFLVGYNDSPTRSLNPGPRIVVADAFTGGGAQADFRRTEYHFSGGDLVTVANGRHELKFGMDVPDISRRGFDDFTNMAGTYTFGSLADYLAGKPSTYLVQRGNGHVVFLEKVLAGFVEDSFRWKRGFSISLGLRYSWQNYFHDDPDNLAPRLAFAYAPRKTSKTVIRGGAGVFYDRTGPLPITDLLHLDGVNLLRFIAENPAYPVAPGSLAAVPTSVVVLDPRARIPYTVQYSIGVERQVTEKSTFSATYTGSRGIDLFRSADINAPLPPGYLARPNPALGQERQIQSEGYQKSNVLELGFRGKPAKYFSGQVQYTLSKAYNNTSGTTYFPANSYNPSADWARSDNDARHRFDFLGSTQVGKFFTAGMALSLYSGKPVTVATGSDNNGDGVLNDRPAGVPRNSLHGPGYINLDLSLSHDFALSARKEAPTLTVSLNSFNVLNHVNDSTYIGVVTSPFFGHAVAANPPRRMQINLQFKF